MLIYRDALRQKKVSDVAQAEYLSQRAFVPELQRDVGQW